jgi:hypothetical protein
MVLAAFIYYRDESSAAYKTTKKGRVKPEIVISTNTALKAVSVAKEAYYLSLSKKVRAGFPMADVKMLYMNEPITNSTFSILNVDPKSEKYQQAYENCLNSGRPELKNYRIGMFNLTPACKN